ncbi:MAG: sugar ABC transporter substrate-binding protein [Eubacteriales bacterium]|nr:sugar ABC transporter substrate-binding protein [Eubacteriales bacterium]
MGNKRPVRRELLLLLLAAAISAIFYILVSSYYNKIMEEAGVNTTELNQVYQYQYEMIVDSRNITFWQAVYEIAREEALSHGAVLKLNGTDWGQDYDKVDFMDMSIAAKVDGIILEYSGEEGLEEKIDEAVEKGIPVVTVVNDAPKSLRQSFVGINDYQLGLAYGEQVAKLVDSNTRRVLVLLNREKELEQNQIYAEINRAVVDKAGGRGKIKIQAQNLISKSQFDVEEAIRTIFQSPEGPPEILVCLDEVTTECAYQAMIDFNMVGEVNIVGYYISKTITDAIENGLIPVTIQMDAAQVGTYSIEALTEYWEVGRANSYYNVDLNIVTKENVVQ